MRKHAVHFTSNKQTWRTPPSLYKALDEEFNFNYDPCPPNPTFDGLGIAWRQSNFINPPYKYCAEWVKKGYEESRLGKVCVFLIPSRTDTKYWHDYILPCASEIRLVKGRLKFVGAANSAPFPSAIVVFGGKVNRQRVFSWSLADSKGKIEKLNAAIKKEVMK